MKKKKTPLQRYEDGEITLQKMFDEQDEETAFQFVLWLVALLWIGLVFTVLLLFYI